MSRGNSSNPRLWRRLRTAELRQVVNGIRDLTRAGCARRRPNNFGPWPSVYHDLRLFHEDGT
ncbi:MAG: hypothetical protein AAGC72_17860 [Planctomycetota bacterium]